MKTLKISLAALFVAAVCLFARQQFVPVVPTSTVAASTGSSMGETLLLTPPASLGGPCGTYNIIYFNGATGDSFGCVNGVTSPIPARIVTGTAANTDAAGFITLVGGVGTLTFTGTYLTPPVCVATDSTAIAATKATATTTVLSVAGTGTDVLAYHCDKRT